MNNKKKLQSGLFILAGIMFLVAAVFSLLAGNKLMSVPYFPLGFCFIAIGFSNQNKGKDDQKLPVWPSATVSIMEGDVMPGIFFHEDDFCQIELLPVENLAFCLNQANSMSDFSEAHKTDMGYTDIFIRKDAPVSMYSKKISAAMLQKTLGMAIPEFEGVFYAASASRSVRCEHTRAFGQAENVVLFYDHEDGLVKNIWLTLHVTKNADIAATKGIFDVLSKTGDFLLADWGWSFIAPLSNFAAIDTYLEARLKDSSAAV